MLTLDVRCEPNSEENVTVTTDDLKSSLDEGEGIRVIPVCKQGDRQYSGRFPTANDKRLILPALAKVNSASAAGDVGVHRPIEICKLGPNQHLKLTAYAKRGFGKVRLSEEGDRKSQRWPLQKNIHARLENRNMQNGPRRAALDLSTTRTMPCGIPFTSTRTCGRKAR